MKWFGQCPTCAAEQGNPCITAYGKTGMANPHRDRPRDPNEPQEFSDEQLLVGAFAVIEGYHRQSEMMGGIHPDSWRKTEQAARGFISAMLRKWGIEGEDAGDKLYDRVKGVELELGAEWLARNQRGF